MDKTDEKNVDSKSKDKSSSRSKSPKQDFTRSEENYDMNSRFNTFSLKKYLCKFFIKKFIYDK